MVRIKKISENSDDYQRRTNKEIERVLEMLIQNYILFKKQENT